MSTGGSSTTRLGRMHGIVNRNHTPDSPALKATLLTTSALTAMAGATIAPALPGMQAAFSDVDNAALVVPLVLTLPSLLIAIGAPIAGYIVDRYGRKPLLVASTLLFGLAGASGYIAPSLVTLLIGRALLGLAVAGMVTSTTTLVADYFDDQARAQFLGLQAAILGVIGTIFIVLGGALANIGWQQPFLMYLFAFVVLPFIIVIVYEPQRAAAKPVLTPLRDPGDCLVEARRATTAAQPDATQKHSPVRLIAFIYATIALIAILFGIVPVLLPFYLQTLTAVTAAQTGLALGVMTLFSALAAALFGWIEARLNHISLLILTFALTGVGYVLFSLAPSWALIVSGLALSGLGIGLLSPNLNVWLMNATPAALRGRVLGGFTTILSLGQFGAPIISQPLSQIVGIAATFGLVGAALLLLGLALVAARGPLGRLTTEGLAYP